MTDEMNQDYIYAMAASPDFIRDGTIFAAKQSGLYKSTDGGNSWGSAYSSLNLDTSLPTTFVILSPDFPGDGAVAAAVEGNILLSHDQGESWKVTELRSPPPIISTMVISPDFAQDGTVLLGTLEDGVIRSVTHGKRWSSWNFGLLDHNVNVLAFSQNLNEDQTVYAGTESGIFYSVTGGRSWQENSFPMDYAPVLSLAVAGEKIFVGTEEHGIFLSGDRGVTWERLLESRIDGSVIQVLANESLDVLIALESEVLLVDVKSGSWVTVFDQIQDSFVSTLAAPQGIRTKAPLLIGLSNGKVIKVG